MALATPVDHHTFPVLSPTLLILQIRLDPTHWQEDRCYELRAVAQVVRVVRA